MSNKKENLDNLSQLFELDENQLKGLTQKIKESKKNVTLMIGRLNDIKQKIEDARREEEERAKALAEEKLKEKEKEKQIKEETVVEEATEVLVEDKPAEEEKKEETANVEEVVATETAPEIEATKEAEKEKESEDKPEEATLEATEKTEEKEKESEKPKKEPTIVNGAELPSNLEKYRAKGVVEPRIFVPQPDKRKAQKQQDKAARPQQQQRPGQAGKQQPTPGTTFVPYGGSQGGKDQRGKGGKQKFDPRNNNGEDKRSNNKRNLIRDAREEGELSDGEVARRFKLRKGRGSSDGPVVHIDHAVVETDPVPIKVLSEKIGRPATEIIKALINLGFFKTANDSIDFNTAELVCMSLDVTLELKLAQTNEDKFEELMKEEEVDPSQLVKRAPIVTIMGHVDHGKTTLLDYIRKANVAKGEAGGITQHIGAYTIRLHGDKITFIDTPGHEAFTTMRARGAMVTDIAIIVVAADDSIMPQTVEAINHAKAAGVPIIVAINKIDRPGANIEKVKADLTKYDLVCEDYGGDITCVPISAKLGTGVDELLDDILMYADMLNLNANPKAKAKGTILEARLDNNVGAVATVLVQNGTLKVGDNLVAGSSTCKVKTMFDDKKAQLKQAGPSIPVQVLGFDTVPNAGDQILVVDEKFARSIAEERRIKEREERINKPASSLSDVVRQMTEGKLKELNIILKCDVQGSVEALSSELVKLSNNEVKVNIVHSGVGAVNASDVSLAEASAKSPDANKSAVIIIAFNVRPDQNAKAAAAAAELEIKTYNVIYEAIEDIQAALKGMLAPKFREKVIGSAEVRSIFKIKGVGTIAGCYVTDGKLDRNAKVRLYRQDVSVYNGAIASLKRLKDDVKEVVQGYECGIGIEKFNDIKEGDVIECYVMEQE
ncbi:MAG: translation initiation factor IF-2 [Clostridia bacterium]|nr:translation initiation factor IF-2 [Clostridia bacterium]